MPSSRALGTLSCSFVAAATVLSGSRYFDTVVGWSGTGVTVHRFRRRLHSSGIWRGYLRVQYLPMGLSASAAFPARLSRNFNSTLARQMHSRRVRGSYVSACPPDNHVLTLYALLLDYANLSHFNSCSLGLCLGAQQNNDGNNLGTQ
jgi:hypothetical protein